MPSHFLPLLRGFAKLLALLGPMVSAHGAVNDVFPNDYVTLPAGMTTVTGYAYLRQSHGPYTNGQKQMDGRLDIPILALRVSHFTRLGNLTFSPMVVLAWARADASPSQLNSLLGKDAEGMADFRVGGTLWLREDWQAREFIAITGTLIVPTGQYDSSSVINIGENRTVLVFNGAWLKPLDSRFSFELLPEIAFYGTNNQYAGENKMQQDPTYALTGTLSYQLSRASQIFTNVQINSGGATSINNAPQNNPGENTRYSVGISHATRNRSQWIIRYSRDLDISNGFKTINELAVRHLIYF